VQALHRGRIHQGGAPRRASRPSAGEADPPATVPIVSADRLDQLLCELRKFTRDRDWASFHDPKNLSMLLASEVGELVQLFRWVRNDEADAFAARPENRPRIEEELADAAIGVLLLADRIGVDLAVAVKAKIERNAAKYPVPEVAVP